MNSPVQGVPNVGQALRTGLYTRTLLHCQPPALPANRSSSYAVYLAATRGDLSSHPLPGVASQAGRRWSYCRNWWEEQEAG